MKAILKYPLFRRTAPTNEVKAIDFLPEDSIIDVEEIVEGKSIDAISSWYKATDGFYYWGGGVKEIKEVVNKSGFIIDPLQNLINYNEKSFKQIPANIKATKGRNVKIAIIDTGVNSKNLSLQGDKIFPLGDFTTSSLGVEDVNGHGSHVAGLIGGRSSQATGILGIAPLSELNIFKGIDDDGSTSSINLNKALQAAIDSGAQIINLSLDIAPIRYVNIESEINRAISKGIIIVAAAGDNAGLLENNLLLCPANKEGIIAIGGCDESFIMSGQKYNKKLDFIIPNYAFWSCSNIIKDYGKEQGCSMATAFVTGIISLILSSSGASNRGAILQLLKTFSIPASEFNPREVCLINPFK